MAEKFTLSYVAVGCFLIACALGCSDSRPSTFPVSGNVKFSSGTPVRTGFVELIPLAGGPSPRGKIGPRGDFTIGTYENADGAAVGDYQVLIIQYAPAFSVANAQRLDSKHQQHAGADALVSPKYSSRDTSDLKCSVSDSEENRFDFIVEAREFSEQTPK